MEQVRPDVGVCGRVGELEDGQVVWRAEVSPDKIVGLVLIVAVHLVMALQLERDIVGCRGEPREPHRPARLN